jgi:hypothetical protein
MNYVMTAQYRTHPSRTSVENAENGPLALVFKSADQKTQRYIHTENTAYVKENLNEGYSTLCVFVKFDTKCCYIQATKNRAKKLLAWPLRRWQDVITAYH